MQLNPQETFKGTPYPFGIDPVWQPAKNKIMFLNSFKMKVSIILGIGQMVFGVMLSLWNHMHKGNFVNMFCEFVPQLVFLMAIFGYLVIMVFLKWVWYDVSQASCAPSLLITLINMFLMKYPTEPCNMAPMYTGQKTLQTALVFIALICIPWMLFVKPIILHIQGKKDPRAETSEEGSGGLGDSIIYQAIHTIEYCLGSISHTASYLRLWALCLAHAQLSEVLWNMILKNGLAVQSFLGAIAVFVVFAGFGVLTIGILLVMEGLSAFLHALRLHWVEFQSKFYGGQGKEFCPFTFKSIIEGNEEDES